VSGWGHALLWPTRHIGKIARYADVVNTVETYVAWNLHEPRPGEFHFENGLDLERYIKLAGGLGLKVILRPGPYICSEWDLGGLPSWLLAGPGMRLRCAYSPYCGGGPFFWRPPLASPADRMAAGDRAGQQVWVFRQR
jgi:hypothetical protein